MHHWKHKDFSRDLLDNSIGFDDLLKRLKERPADNYPPHNIYRDPETNNSVIEIAVAGFTKQDIVVESENRTITVTGKLNTPKIPAENYTHRGLSFRDFKRKFTLVDNSVVKSVKLEDGILKIVVEAIIPARDKKKTYSL